MEHQCRRRLSAVLLVWTLAVAGAAMRVPHALTSLHGGRCSIAAPLPAAAQRTRPPRSCICINCKWVDRCKTYHWVEEQHEQQHLTADEDLDFDPDDPQIQVFIRKEGVVAANVTGAADDGSTDGMLAAVISTEYDVFECDGFDEDKGKWLRLMPDAGFIPT